MIIGRNNEIRELTNAYNSEYSEFVAVYGRRRVGKTFLVRETFSYTFTFEHSGVANGNNRTQLRAFRDSLADAGMGKVAIPSNWMDAFALLRQFIKKRPEEKKVIFIDEIPWMDTPRSDFVSALEYFWNTFASARKDVLLIICGSATSWIINKVLKNHGGLHNRVTYRVALQPFTLHECEEYMKSRKIRLSRYDLLELYMVFGGVPFYWSLLNKGESVSQNIDRLVFSESGKLHNEYYELYDSLFKNSELYISIVTILGACLGMTREELVKKSDLDGNGKTTRVLDDLQACGFIKKTPTYGLKNQAVYMLIDNFTLFYQKFVKETETSDEQFWSHSYQSTQHNAWVGIAFERVCFQHIPQIKMALGISGVVTNVYSWRIGPSFEGAKDGAQIDMLIDRADNMVNICEMKFSKKEYIVTQDDSTSMSNKAERFSRAIGFGKSISMTMITVNGIAKAGYWSDIHNVVTADDLFKNS
jgi:AAA+ ATPase superfamily predicted ATPase